MSEAATTQANLDKLYSNLHHLISAVEKGSTADVSVRLRSVESDIETLRESIRAIADIDTEKKTQINKIRSLQKQIAGKDELIASFVDSGSGERLIDGQPSDASKNDVAVHCSHCSSKILVPGAALYQGGGEKQLPLARQQKGAPDTQTESVADWWQVKDMFDFENVGFTHDVKGVKYLVCADCEYGPIGMVDPESKLHLVALDRVVSK